MDFAGGVSVKDVDLEGVSMKEVDLEGEVSVNLPGDVDGEVEVANVEGEKLSAGDGCLL